MNDSIKRQFFIGVRWNVFGSLYYEGIKLLHQVLLLKHMRLENYGTIGGLFSFTFLFINLASLGAEQSIVSFTREFLKSKLAFRKLFIPYISINIISLTIAAILSYIFIPIRLYDGVIRAYSIPQLLILIEGLRIFFRSFLHAFNIHKYPVIIESLFTTVYFAVTWSLFFFGAIKVTPFIVLTFYLLGSIGVVTLFIFKVINLYDNISDNALSDDYRSTLKRIFRIRCYNYLINFSRNLFTGNFMVAILASRFSLLDAGIFKFASYISDAIRGVAHAIINFSGGSFLALLRNSSIENKREGFKIINNSLSKVIFLSFFLLMTNVPTSGARLSTMLFVAGIFLMLAFLEQYTSVYTQFFTVEEHLLPLLFQKGSELLLISYILYLSGNSSALMVLLSLLVVKFFSFVTLATEGYFHWKLVPSLIPSFRFLVFCGIITLFTNYIIYLLI